MHNVFRAVLASLAASSMTFGAVPAVNASALEYHSAPVSSDSRLVVSDQDQILIDEVAEHLLEGFKELDQYIDSDFDGTYVVNHERVQNSGINSHDAGAIQNLVSTLNSQRGTQLYQPSPYSTRSWSSFGLCVVGGVTGVQVKEISSYVAWKEFGTAIKAKDWGTALNFLKAGVTRYMERHGAKAGAKVALKQILNASGVGFAAQAAVAAVGCAALEGWRWWWS
ncbi:hypothetical protein [Arcanobacterium hippocoleae]|uniref:hypothetical protein n=1 Tax=Arcanobacterium hippocoleae TaxID=149017 RepID=UPI003341F1D0